MSEIFEAKKYGQHPLKLAVEVDFIASELLQLVGVKGLAKGLFAGQRADMLARDPDEQEEGEESATADAEGLRHFLETVVLPWFDGRKKELSNRAHILLRKTFHARFKAPSDCVGYPTVP